MNMIRRSFQLPVVLAANLKELSKEMDISQAEIVRQALELYFKTQV